MELGYNRHRILAECGKYKIRICIIHISPVFDSTCGKQSITVFIWLEKVATIHL